MDGDNTVENEDLEHKEVHQGKTDQAKVDEMNFQMKLTCLGVWITGASLWETLPVETCRSHLNSSAVY